MKSKNKDFYWIEGDKSFGDGGQWMGLRKILPFWMLVFLDSEFCFSDEWEMEAAFFNSLSQVM